MSLMEQLLDLLLEALQVARRVFVRNWQLRGRAPVQQGRGRSGCVDRAACTPCAVFLHRARRLGVVLQILCAAVAAAASLVVIWLQSAVALGLLAATLPGRLLLSLRSVSSVRAQVLLEALVAAVLRLERRIPTLALRRHGEARLLVLLL